MEQCQVLSVLGKGDEQKVNMVKALQDYSNMIKVLTAARRKRRVAVRNGPGAAWAGL